MGEVRERERETEIWQGREIVKPREREKRRLKIDIKRDWGLRER